MSVKGRGKRGRGEEEERMGEKGKTVRFEHGESREERNGRKRFKKAETDLFVLLYDFSAQAVEQILRF